MKMKKRAIAVLLTVFAVLMLTGVSVAAKPNYKKLYGNFLKKYSYEYKTGYKYNGKTQKYTIRLNYKYYKYGRGYYREPNKSIKFTLLDVDGNGTKELLLFNQYKKGNTGTLYVFTIKGNKVKYAPLKTETGRTIYINSGKLQYNKKKKAFVDVYTSSSSNDTSSNKYKTVSIYVLKGGSMELYRQLYTSSTDYKDPSTTDYKYYNVKTGDGKYLTDSSSLSSTYTESVKQYNALYKEYVNSGLKSVKVYKNSESNRKKHLK